MDFVAQFAPNMREWLDLRAIRVWLAKHVNTKDTECQPNPISFLL
jgi:hypothetical protein